MISTEEIVDLSELLTREGFKSSPYQIFAAQQVLRNELIQSTGAGSLVRLSSLLGPIFCRTPEEQQKFEDLYLQWLRQRSGRPHTIFPLTQVAEKKSEVSTIHWRMKVLGIALLILPILTAWFLWQDLRLRQVVGHVMTEERVALQATVRLGEQAITTDADGKFSLAFQAKDMPMELAVGKADFLPSLTPIGQAIKANRNWFYLHPLDWSDQLDIGEIFLSKEEQPPGSQQPVTESAQLPPSKLSLEKIATLKSPTPPSWERLDYEILGKVLAPVLLALGWLLYLLTRRRGLQRQSSRIPPELKHVQVQAGTQHIFPSLSLRHITQRLRQTRFVESTELDVPRTIQLTMDRGGLFTPVYGSKHEPGYVALIDRATMADHQAHLAGQLVKDVARGYVLVRQYEFDEQPIMLRRVDPLRPSPKHGAGGTALATAVEVVPLEDVQAKFPARRLLCFADPITFFDPLTGKLRPWVETLEAWEERFLLTTTPDGQWGQAERILSRRGFQVLPLSLLGLRLFSTLLEQGSFSGANQKSVALGTTSFYDRMPERWLERHPPSQEFIHRLLVDLEKDFSQEKEGVNSERGKQGMLWLAACAAYPEIHWGLTLEWGVRLFGQGLIAERLLPKLTRLIWFRQAFMPDWFRKALYDRLTGPEADRISLELSEILSAVNPENREGLHLHIATQPGEKPEPASPVGPIRAWFRRLRRKLKLQAVGKAAQPGSPMGDYVMLQYLSGKQGKALTPYAPKALLRFLFPKGQPWLGFRPVFLMVAAVLAFGGLWWWLDPIPVPLPSPIQAVALSQDGKHLAVGREDGRLQVWDWKTNQMVLDVTGEQAHSTSLALSADGKLGATGYQDGKIRVWDGIKGKEMLVLSEHKTPLVSLTFSTDGTSLASTGEEGQTVMTHIKTGQSQPVSFPKDAKGSSALAFSPNGTWLALGSAKETIWLLSGRKTVGESISPTRPVLRAIVSDGSTGEVASLVWDPTGNFLMSYSEDGAVRIWNQETGQLLTQEQIGQSELGSLSWSTESEAWLALLGAEGPEVWRVEIPLQLLQQGMTRQEQEKAAALKALEEARLREAKAAEKEKSTIEAQKLVIEKTPQQSDTQQRVMREPQPTQLTQQQARQVENLPSQITGKDGAPMVWVPAGEFTMGSREGVRADERPAHQVYLDAFYIDQYEVTTSRYAKFLQETVRNSPEFWSDRVLKKHPRKPVGRVDWEDAQAYCEWAGKRLPTEAEWEKAARGTDQRLFPWGNETPNKKLANFGKCCEFNDYGVLTDVGSYEGGKSPYGAYDMAGNVWEWVADWYDGKIYQKRVEAKEQPTQNPRGPDSGDYKVLRGGAWGNGTVRLRSIERYEATPSLRIYGGIRCAGDSKKLAFFNKEIQQTLPAQKESSQIPQEIPTTQAQTNEISQTSQQALQQQDANDLSQPGKLMDPQESLLAAKLPTKITGKDGAPMVLVPAGEFTIGTWDASEDERPAHLVYLDPYYIDQFEVTNSLYYKFFRETKRDPPSNELGQDPIENGEKKPVYGVTWGDAKAYCAWVGKRLPTEAEWEKAARGTDGRVYPWGNDPPNKKLANFDVCCDLLPHDMDVGSFEGGKSPYGAYDMAGNVKEWVADWYEKNLYHHRANQKSPIQNPSGPEKGGERVFRGGSWYYEETGRQRSTYRNGDNPSSRSLNVGFRCAQDARR